MCGEKRLRMTRKNKLMSHSLLRVQPKSHYKEENGYASQKSNPEETLAFYGNGIVIIRQRPPILLGDLFKRKSIN